MIKCHYSGSAGNLYQVGEILIDPGVPIKKIKEALDFRLSGVRGCLLSHPHMDHAKGAKDIMKAGVELYTSRGTADELGLSGHRLHVIEQLKEFKIGRWVILPFPTIHDTKGPLGFLLSWYRWKVLFITDSQYVPYQFKGLTHIMIEAGYSAEIVRKNVKAGLVDVEVGKRVLHNHMSIETAIKFLEETDLSRAQAVYLLHLSDNNSDAAEFKAIVEKKFGIPTIVA